MAAMQPHPLMRDRTADLSRAAARLFEQALAALGRENPAAAEPLLDQLRAMAPECAEVLRAQGLCQHLRGNYVGAEAMLRQALSLRPGDVLILMNLGTSLCARGDFAPAKALLQRACDLAPDFPPAWFNLGRMLHIQGRHGGAIPLLFRALDLDPEYIPARVVLAEAQASFGAVAEASASYRGVLRRQRDHANAWIGLSRLPGEAFGADDAAPLQRVMLLPQLAAPSRIALGFALARALESARQYAAAFRALRKANALQRRQLPWDAVVASGYVDSLLEAFAAPFDGASDEHLGGGVMVLTSLAPAQDSPTVQWLLAHGQVGGAATASDLQQVLDDESARRACLLELWVGAATPSDWRRLGQDYLARTHRKSADNRRVLDLSSFNWLLVGAAMAMLPAARVLELRRDPLETCFACYRHGYAHGHAFSYDLDSVVSCYADYVRLCRHWQALFGERYMVQDEASPPPDRAAQTRRLLAFCGLEPESAAVQPVLSPVRDHAASYGHALSQLRALLGAGAAGG